MAEWGGETGRGLTSHIDKWCERVESKLQMRQAAAKSVLSGYTVPQNRPQRSAAQRAVMHSMNASRSSKAGGG